MEANEMKFGYAAVINEAMRTVDTVIAIAVRDTVEDAAKGTSVDELVERAVANILFPRKNWNVTQKDEVMDNIKAQCCEGVYTCKEVVIAVYDKIQQMFNRKVNRCKGENPWKSYIYLNAWHQVSTMVEPSGVTRQTIEAMAEAKADIMDDVYEIGSEAIDNFADKD